MPVLAGVKRLLQAGFLLLAFHAGAYATVFSVNNPTIDQIGNGYVLNAQISYPLTPAITEALEHGVPITFVQELELVHAIPLLGKFWHWDNTLWQTELRYELRYHALTEQYVVLSLDTHNRQSFPTLRGALATLGHIEGLSLPPEHTAKTDNLILRIRSGLDLHALPTPMRAGALISSQWQLTSPWVSAVWR